jgi:hypothetical protein
MEISDKEIDLIYQSGYDALIGNYINAPVEAVPALIRNSYYRTKDKRDFYKELEKACERQRSIMIHYPLHLDVILQFCLLHSLPWRKRSGNTTNGQFLLTTIIAILGLAFSGVALYLSMKDESTEVKVTHAQTELKATDFKVDTSGHR